MKLPPLMPFQFTTSKTYLGLTEMMESEIDFLKATVLSKSTSSVIMYSDMPMGEMAKDPEFLKKWMFGMAMMLKKGLHLHQIHNLDRSFEDMMLGLESWIPMYMTGQISPYYLKDTQNHIFLHLLKVSGAAALSGEAIVGHQENGRYYLTKSKEEILYYRNRAEELLHSASPLMDIYRADNVSALQAFLLSDSHTKGKRRNILSALSVKNDYLQLDTPSYLGELWPLYTSSIDMFTQYLYAQSWGAAGDVLRQYSSAQLISRMGIVASAYENAIYELMAREYIHCEDVIDQNLKVLGTEILDGCKNGTLPQDSYMQMSSVLFTNYTLIDEIYPNLYPATNSIVNLAIYTDKDFRDVTITAEIPGFTQVYEQKLTITPEITYLMIKPPVLSDMPDLSSAKDTQLIFKITDNITGDIIAQERFHQCRWNEAELCSSCG